MLVGAQLAATIPAVLAGTSGAAGIAPLETLAILLPAARFRAAAKPIFQPGDGRGSGRKVEAPRALTEGATCLPIGIAVAVLH